MRTSKFSAVSALLAAAALTALAPCAMANDNDGSLPRVTVQSTGAGSSVTLADGRVLRTTGDAVVNVRVERVNGAVLVRWDEVSAGAQTPYYTFSTDEGLTFVEAIRSDNYIHLRYAKFDPAAGAPTVAPEFAAGIENNVYIVNFVVQPLPGIQEVVAAAGGTIHRYLVENTLLVQADPAAIARIGTMAGVRWIGAYHPAYKLDSAIMERLATTPENASVRYSIECHERGIEAQDRVAAHVVAIGGEVNIQTPGQHRMEATLTPAQLLSVLRLDDVHYVDDWGGPGGADMDLARQIGGAHVFLSGLGFSGQGVRAEVFDTGLQQTHPAFQSPAPLMHPASGVVDSHGSSTYGICFGNGAGNAAGTGMLPNREQGIFCQYNLTSQFGGAFTRLALNQELVNPAGPYRGVFQTSSVGNTQILNYSTISREVDDYLFITDLLSCQSQSNTGNQNSRPQAWAKNIVSGGGIGHQNTLTRADDSWVGASTGPAADGRVKPDLAHFYDNILTTTTGGGYTTGFGGTSGATPIICGHFGLLFQMWHQSVFTGFGGGSSVFASRPKMATAKALMINSAFRYTWTNSGGSGTIGNLNRFRQGWGMPDLGNLYNRRNVTYVVNETDLLTPGATKTYTLQVAAGQPTLNVTMVYTDLPGSTATLPHRINDLSLRVTSPSGTIYWGNNGLTAGNFNTSGGVSNTIDTVENVFVNAPATGTWTISVIGSVIAADSHPETTALDADYALVAVGGTVPVCCVDFNNDNEIDFSDIEGFLAALAAKVPGNCKPGADFNNDGEFDFSDIEAFVGQYNAALSGGC